MNHHLIYDHLYTYITELLIFHTHTPTHTQTHNICIYIYIYINTSMCIIIKYIYN